MKDRVSTMIELYEEIKMLEALEVIQMAKVKELTQEVLDSLKPSALVKNAFNEIISSKSIKKTAINSTIGLGAGVLVKSIIGINSPGLLRGFASFLFQVITTKLVAKKAPILISKIVNAT
jgi:hypothetical protein